MTTNLPFDSPFDDFPDRYSPPLTNLPTPRRPQESGPEATIMALYREGSIEADWIGKESRWAISQFIQTDDSRIQTTEVWGGYYSKGLANQPSMIALTLMYAPLGWIGNPYPIRAERWYRVLSGLSKLRKETVRLDIGGISFGSWILKRPVYTYQNWAKVLTTNRDAVLVPRMVQCQLNFTSDSEYGDSDSDRITVPALDYIDRELFGTPFG